MRTLVFSEQFDKSFSKIKDKNMQKQVWNKLLELGGRAPIGKKLKGNPFWSIHVNRFRIIYKLEDKRVIIADILQRKKGYREV